MGHQLTIGGARGACLLQLGRRPSHAEAYFARTYALPLVTAGDVGAFPLVLLSLHSLRDAFALADLAPRRAANQCWIAGGNAVVNPTPIAWALDYAFIGEAFHAFPALLAGQRDHPSLLDCRDPAAMARYSAEPVFPEPYAPREIAMSVGCRRRCLFCIMPWRRPYAEQPEAVIRAWLPTVRGVRVQLSSNAANDVSYYERLQGDLHAAGKVNAVASNVVGKLTDAFLASRSAEILLGIEGMSERLRASVRKPIPRALLVDRVRACLERRRQVRLVYQFNLPGEAAADFKELLEDVAAMTAGFRAGSIAIPFIPHQPSAHTPMQWDEPRYDLDMLARIQAFRRWCFGSRARGVSIYVPQPLGPGRWFAQVAAQWIPVTKRTADVLRGLPGRAPVPDMVAACEAQGVPVAAVFRPHARTEALPRDRVAVGTPRAALWEARGTPCS